MISLDLYYNVLLSFMGTRCHNFSIVCHISQIFSPLQVFILDTGIVSTSLKNYPIVRPFTSISYGVPIIHILCQFLSKYSLLLILYARCFTIQILGTRCRILIM